MYAAGDQRLINIRYARAVLPSIIVSGILQALSMSGRLDNLAISLSFTSSWWSTLVMFTITQRFVMMFMTDSTDRARFYDVQADLPYIRITIILAAILSTILFQISNSKVAGGGFSPNIALGRIVEEPRILSLYLGGMVWLTLLFADLKKAKMVNVGWGLLVLSCMLSLVAMGPGGTLLTAWAWREEVLATRKHWAAVTKAG